MGAGKVASLYNKLFGIYVPSDVFEMLEQIRISLIVSGKVFQIDAAMQENALATFAFFEPLVAMSSRDDDRKSRVDL